MYIKTYQAGELYFAVVYHDDSFCVHFRTIHPAFDDDNLGGHNIDNNALRAAGLNTCENEENVFAVLEDDTKENIIKRVEAAGFIYSAELQEAIKSCESNWRL